MTAQTLDGLAMDDDGLDLGDDTEDGRLVGRQGLAWNCINSSRRHRAPSIGSGVTS